MIKQKRGSTWIWILIVIVLIAVGLGVYFWLSGDTSSIISSGGSIPQPPALPN